MSTDLSTPRTLYLLDDNDDFRATAKWWLSGAGYDVIDFGDAQAAIDALAALDAAALTRACLLLDVRMPSMTGLQVHDVLIEKGITGARARPSLPIVYMTGHGDVPLAVQAMEKGAITFLEKPFEDSALESALARAFEAGAQSQHTAAAEPASIGSSSCQSAGKSGWPRTCSGVMPVSAILNGSKCVCGSTSV